MHCTLCGQENPPEARFCTACGRALAQETRASRAAAGPALPYASFGRRLGAFAVDALLVYAVLFGLGAAALTRGWNTAAVQAALLVLVYPVVLGAGWLYWAGLESSGWQGTLGKRAFGLTVTDLSGARISFGRATGRYFGKLVSGMTFYLGFLMAAFTMRKQALHDLLAGTLVLQRPPEPSPLSTTPLPHRQNDMNKPFYP